jgi:hypothetical protein
LFSPRAGFPKQLHFVQRVRSILKIACRAAVVVPDNVPFVARLVAGRAFRGPVRVYFLWWNYASAFLPKV